MKNCDLKLLDEWRHDRISEADFDRLQQRLEESAELRAELRAMADLEEALVQQAVEPLPVANHPPEPQRARQPLLWAAAALILIASGIALLNPPSPHTVATLTASEGAAWESSFSTSVGSRLTPGRMILSSGLATLRFDAGAELTLESPAHLIIVSEECVRLEKGTATIYAPESAIGFLVETPVGYGVDHGTRFTVQVGGSRGWSVFEVHDGAITVHHRNSGDTVRLIDQQAAIITATGVERVKSGFSVKSVAQRETPDIRLTTHGRNGSIVRRDNNRDHLNRLMVKTSRFMPAFDRRAVFSFDTSALDLSSIASCCIRLNLVDQDSRKQSYLPKVSQFAVYAIDPIAWSDALLWKDVPSPESGRLVGGFDIQRGRTSGSFVVQSDELLDVVKSSNGDPLTFLLVRQTGEERSNGPIHYFAPDSHPTTAGPALEIFLKNSQDVQRR